MMHEIIEEDEWLNPDTAFQDEDQPDNTSTDNQRLEVVKITRCKMRARDILEIEIGLKNI